MNTSAVRNDDIQSIPSQITSGIAPAGELNSNVFGKINSEAHVLYKQCMILAKIPAGEMDSRYQVKLQELRNGLRDYLKLVSVELYLNVRRNLGSSSNQAEFVEFEQQTTEVNSKIAVQLSRLDLKDLIAEKFTESGLYQIGRLLIDRYQEERTYLHPLYLQLIHK